MNSQSWQNIVPLAKRLQQNIDRDLAIRATRVSTNTQAEIEHQQELARASW